MHRKGRSKPAFTLVEMLVVILLIAVLVSILLPALARAREQARQVNCASNLRQFGLGITNYATQNNGVMPPCDQNLWWYLLPYTGDVPRVQVGPYVGTTVDLYRCPSDKYNDLGLAGSSYAFNYVGPIDGTHRCYYPGGAPYCFFANWDWVHWVSNQYGSPFSTTAMGDLAAGSCASNPPWPGQAKYYSSSPGDTYLMIEQWGYCGCEQEPGCHHGDSWSYAGRLGLAALGIRAPFSGLNFDRPDSDGAAKHALHENDRRSSPTWGYLYKYNVYKAAWRGWVENSMHRMVYPGQCGQVWPWAHQGKTGFREAFHHGRVNVLFADGHVNAESVWEIAGTCVKFSPQWSAMLD